MSSFGVRKMDARVAWMVRFFECRWKCHVPAKYLLPLRFDNKGKSFEFPKLTRAQKAVLLHTAQLGASNDHGLANLTLSAAGKEGHKVNQTDDVAVSGAKKIIRRSLLDSLWGGCDETEESDAPYMEDAFHGLPDLNGIGHTRAMKGARGNRNQRDSCM